MHSSTGINPKQVRKLERALFALNQITENVSLPVAMILVHVARHSGTGYEPTPKEISNELKLHPSTVSRAIAVLKDSLGMLEVTAAKDDKRCRNLKLTQSGIETVGNVFAKFV